jgi:NitT/TauT family transport system ATP-binding protein
VTTPRRDIGLVFQAPTLLPWANVLGNVLFPLKLLKRDLRAGERTARDLLELAGLKGFERHAPRQLSGGMQQRVALCRALVHDPEILLMDEPFGALDALTREEMSLELLRIWEERRKTVLLVTHSIAEALTLGDRVVVMSPRPGRIVDVIDVALPRPRSLAVQGTARFQTLTERIRGHIFGDRGGARAASA